MKLSEILTQTASESQANIDYAREHTDEPFFYLDPVWLLKLADACRELEQRVERLEWLESNLPKRYKQ